MINNDKQLTALVVNTHSRRGRNLFFRSTDLLRKHNIEVTDLHPVDNPGQLKELIQELINKNYTRIIVGGGDGSISSIVDYFVGMNTILGILPLGTSNSFARSLLIPMDLEGAIKVIEQGNIFKADLGSINGNYFSNTATIGFSARIARTIDDNLKKYFGRIGYIVHGVKLFLTHKSFSATITANNKVYKLKTLELIIANGRFHGGISLSEKASLQSHKILIMNMKGENKWNLLKVWIAILFGRQRGLKEIVEINTKEALIETDRPMYVDIDGEIAMKTPITVSLKPEALCVFAPVSK